jgi:hypothetical protein
VRGLAKTFDTPFVEAMLIASDVLYRMEFIILLSGAG